MAWHTVVLKLAPYLVALAQTGASAIPHFTKRKGTAALENEAQTTHQQIAELQSAVTQNAENIRALASDLKNAITTIEEGGEALESRLRRLEMLAYSAVVLSILAGIFVLALWLR